MSEFIVTEEAGKEVAGIANPGAGETITLSEAQAEHALRIGHIKRAPADKLVKAAKE